MTFQGFIFRPCLTELGDTEILVLLALLLNVIHPFIPPSHFGIAFPVLPKWQRICHRLGWRHLPSIRSASWPGTRPILARQHHLRHHLCGLLPFWAPVACWLRWLQLQHLGLHEGRPTRFGGRLKQLCGVFMEYLWLQVILNTALPLFALYVIQQPFLVEHDAIGESAWHQLVCMLT